MRRFGVDASPLAYARVAVKVGVPALLCASAVVLATLRFVG